MADNARSIRANGFRFANEYSQEPIQPDKVRDNIESLKEALEVFKYNAGATLIQEISLEGARVGALFRRDGTGKTYVVLYKREFYLYFSRHFMHVPERGYGVLCNHKLVYFAALNDHRIAAVFPDGRCYWIDGLKFQRYFEEYETECPKIPGEIATPLSMWERLF